MDFSADSLFSALFAALLVQWVRKFLKTKERVPDWDPKLAHVWIAFGLLVPISAGLDKGYLMGLIWLVAFVYMAQTAKFLREYQPSRTLFMGVLPFMLVIFVLNMLEGFAPSLFKAADPVLDVLMPVISLWLLATFFLARRQQKDWVKLEAERAVEAEQRRIAEAKKQELEYLVSERTAEITRQKEELQHALAELKATQDQLIQREKLASLGELTAGIAHEIQNPLNFVNNFSEVSAELVKEIKEERDRGEDRDEGLELELLEDLAQNLLKITHHGGRASSIVRGMLQHSRASTGQRELTDINALADEYLKLSYHGLRAKDKNGPASRFNAKFEIIADPSIGQVSVVSQDIGRVLLNLFNNAFYATQQRTKQEQVAGYQPTVTVTTECANAKVRIRVRDNGTGMPEEVKAKIFQPFYTTKPTGEGTGLGLSLSYDIVTKGHGGTISVESWPGAGTEFVIELPA